MKEKDFRTLIDVLRLLKTEDTKRKQLNDAIIKIIDHQNHDLTPEQKEVVSKRFSQYELKRIEKSIKDLKYSISDPSSADLY